MVHSGTSAREPKLALYPLIGCYATCIDRLCYSFLRYTVGRLALYGESAPSIIELQRHRNHNIVFGVFLLPVETQPVTGECV